MSHRGAKASKPDVNHANHPNHILGQKPNFQNSLRGFDRQKEHSLKAMEPTGICQTLPYYRDKGPNNLVCHGLDKHAIGLPCKPFEDKVRVSFCSYKPAYIIVILC